MLVGANEGTGQSVGFTEEQIDAITRLLETSQTAGVHDVAALAALGPFPPDDAPEEDGS